MSVLSYMDINGVMRCKTSLNRRFILPDKKNITCSLRFGAHSFVMKETMQILPVGSYSRVPLRGQAENSDQEQIKRFIKKILNQLNVRSFLM